MNIVFLFFALVLSVSSYATFNTQGDLDNRWNELKGSYARNGSCPALDLEQFYIDYADFLIRQGRPAQPVVDQMTERLRRIAGVDRDQFNTRFWADYEVRRRATRTLALQPPRRETRSVAFEAPAQVLAENVGEDAAWRQLIEDYRNMQGSRARNREQMLQAFRTVLQVLAQDDVQRERVQGDTLGNQEAGQQLVTWLRTTARTALNRAGADAATDANQLQAFERRLGALIDWAERQNLRAIAQELREFRSSLNDNVQVQVKGQSALRARSMTMGARSQSRVPSQVPSLVSGSTAVSSVREGRSMAPPNSREAVEPGRGRVDYTTLETELTDWASNLKAKVVTNASRAFLQDLADEHRVTLVIFEFRDGEWVETYRVGASLNEVRVFVWSQGVDGWTCSVKRDDQDPPPPPPGGAAAASSGGGTASSKRPRRDTTRQGPESDCGEPKTKGRMPDQGRRKALLETAVPQLMRPFIRFGS